MDKSTVVPRVSDTKRKPHFLFAFYMAGGNATIYANLKNAITRRDDIITSWLPIEMYPVDAITRVPPLSWNGSLANSFVTKKRIRALEAGGVRFDAAYYFQHTIITFLSGLRRRVPYVLAMDGTPLWYAKNELWYAHPYFRPQSLLARVKRQITKRVYEGAYRLLPLSNGVKKSLIEDYEIERDKINVVPPGIDLKQWSAPERECPRADGVLKVLFVGAAFERKGGTVLAQVALQEEFRSVQFHFVTKEFNGPKGPNIIVHPDMLANDDRLMRLYREADVFALPTMADSYSIASLEAMAMRLPVITTRVGGIEDIVTHGRNGLFVEQGDPRTLSEALRLLVHDPVMRSRMGTNARSRVQAQFNLERVSDEVVAILSAAVRSNRKGR